MFKENLSKVQIEIALVLIKAACFFKFWGFNKPSALFEKWGDYFCYRSKMNCEGYDEEEFRKCMNEIDDMVD